MVNVYDLERTFGRRRESWRNVEGSLGASPSAVLARTHECMTFPFHSVPIEVHFDLIVHSLPTTVSTSISEAVVVPSQDSSASKNWHNEGASNLTIGLENNAVEAVFEKLL